MFGWVVIYIKVSMFNFTFKSEGTKWNKYTK